LVGQSLSFKRVALEGHCSHNDAGLRLDYASFVPKLESSLTFVALDFFN